MSNSPALDIEYRKVIPAKFVTKRDGSPMLCMTCATPLAMGQAFAATKGDGAWHSYCAKCATSPQAQIGGLVTRIEALVEALNPVPAAILAEVSDISRFIEAVLNGGTSTDDFLHAKRGLLDIRVSIGEAKRTANADPAERDSIEALRALIVSRVLTGRDISFADSLVSQYDRKGSLSPKQWPYVSQIVARYAKGSAAPECENGLYLHDDGKIRKLYTTQNDRQACKVLIIHGDHGSFDYVSGGVRIVRDAVASGTARMLTEAEAREFGKLHGFCVNCARDLDDDRSLAVGYGPVCAKRYGWYYPTTTEAAAMLNRPTEVDETVAVVSGVNKAAKLAAAAEMRRRSEG